MTAYPALLQSMMDAILDGEAPQETLFSNPRGFEVHRDGYRLRLCEVLETAYLATRDALGAEAFRALALRYIASHPSRRFNIDRYPLGFAATMSEPFATALAALEEAIHASYHAAEAPARGMEWLAAQSQETLAQAQFLLHPSVKLLELDYPVNAYLAEWREGQKPAIPAPALSYIVVWRNRNQVQRAELSAAEYQLLRILSEGKNLSEALDDARLTPYAEEADFAGRLIEWITGWLGEGRIKDRA